VRRLPGHAELTGKSEISFYSVLQRMLTHLAGR
jgi:hypothetical protein